MSGAASLVWRIVKIGLWFGVGLTCLAVVLLGGGMFWYDNQTKPCMTSKGDAAIAACSAYLKSDQWAHEVLAHRGYAYYDTGAYDLAIADFTKSLSITGNDARVNLARGNAYAAKKQIAQARADWEAALRSDDGGGSHAAAKQNLEKIK